MSKIPFVHQKILADPSLKTKTLSCLPPLCDNFLHSIIFRRPIPPLTKGDALTMVYHRKYPTPLHLSVPLHPLSPGRGQKSEKLIRQKIPCYMKLKVNGN